MYYNLWCLHTPQQSVPNPLLGAGPL